jgi:hypothetical protein
MGEQEVMRMAGRVGLRVVSVVTLVVLQSACTHAPVKPQQPVVDPSMQELNTIAAEARNTLGKLAFAQNAMAASAVTPQGMQTATLAATAEPAGWDQLASLNYEGPFNTLVERLALKAGYKFALYGKAPAAAPLVNVSVKDAPLIEILRDVVAQVPETVQINVYPATKSVTVSFRG